MRYQGVEVIEGDFRLHDRYVIERFIRGGLAFTGDLTRRDNHREYRNCRIKSADYTPKLRALSLDIECAMDGELYSVGLVGDGIGVSIKEVLMIGSPEPCDETRIRWFDNELELLKGLIGRIKEIDPDLINRLEPDQLRPENTDRACRAAPASFYYRQGAKDGHLAAFKGGRQ